MSGDYTRMSFAPRKRFAGVLMQQGRVQTDRDWNEQADIVRERVRLLGLDSGGAAWVAWPTTPDAFLVGTIAGPPADLSLQPGRIYVDGRLAEIFAGEAVTYLNQPFLPAAPPVNPAVDTIVYLDLWEREVTWVEDGSLLDVALGGVDTTTRVQQVWQVKLHQQPGVAAACGVDLDALFPPSGGRLSSSANAPPAPNDPCILPPNAGYRGIENRLYRVEVVRGGALGVASFAWSRDNGSIVSRVLALAVGGGQTRVTVNRLGRDAILGFAKNDWVMVTDDHRELNGEAGQMARIFDIDVAANTIVLDRAIPAAGRAFGANAAEIAARHTRIQRWDAKAPGNAVDAEGLMQTGAGPIALEDGVEVSFSVAGGGQFKVGDAWIFAARTADASVETLVQAPPSSIRHQYLQLAAIPAGGVPTDCRPPAPTDGCCTFVVHPGDSIQAAIDAMPAAGGCICLKAGVHQIGAPLQMNADNVTIHGESMGAVIENQSGSGIVHLYGGMRNRIHSLTMRQESRGSMPPVMMIGALDTEIADCHIVNASEFAVPAVMLTACEATRVRGCSIAGSGIGIECDKGCFDIAISDCTIAMPAPSANLPFTIAIIARAMAGPIDIGGNSITGALSGIIVDDDPDGMPASGAHESRIQNNRLRMIDPGGGRNFGIDIAGEHAIVSDNHIIHDGGALIAIRIAGSGGQVRGNHIVCRAQVPGLTVAIVAGHEENSQKLPLDNIAICGNRIGGHQQGIVLVGVSQGIVADNLLSETGETMGLGITLNDCDDVRVAGNQIRDAMLGVFLFSGARNSIVDTRIDRGMIGIGAFGETALSIRGCAISRASFAGIGIAIGVDRCEVVENRVTMCGGGEGAIGIGIGAGLIWGVWHVESNDVSDTGMPGDGGAGGPAIALGIWGELIREARVESNTVAYAFGTFRDGMAEDRALLMSGLLETEIDFGATALHIGFPAQIANNSFAGGGKTALVELRAYPVTDRLICRFERVQFTANHCAHVAGLSDDVSATVHLNGGRLTVANNQVKAITKGFPSYNLYHRPGPFIGNVSHAGTLGRTPAQEFPVSQGAFNQIG